jgi:hypothetical protein
MEHECAHALPYGCPAGFRNCGKGTLRVCTQTHAHHCTGPTPSPTPAPTPNSRCPQLVMQGNPVVHLHAGRSAACLLCCVCKCNGCVSAASDFKDPGARAFDVAGGFFTGGQVWVDGNTVNTKRAYSSCGSCWEILQAMKRMVPGTVPSDGNYFVTQFGREVLVYCNMHTDGGGYSLVPARFPVSCAPVSYAPCSHATMPQTRKQFSLPARFIAASSCTDDGLKLAWLPSQVSYLCVGPVVVAYFSVDQQSGHGALCPKQVWS